DDVRAISIDARCLRGKCEEDNKFGYEMMTRFVPILVERLGQTRIQLLDIYSHNG
ncbi:MAG: Crp/Fnr family transcriptional regulator, partial [Gammaproteobacteria bacterium]|nr:Crp/Fnr family transcriptional regulator [Gammaproteobacteria bacterium]